MKHILRVALALVLAAGLGVPLSARQVTLRPSDEHVQKSGDLVVALGDGHEIRKARQGDLVIVRLCDGREIMGAALLVRPTDIAGARSAVNGAELERPVRAARKNGARISKANKILIVVVRSLAAVLLLAYLTNPRD